MLLWVNWQLVLQAGIKLNARIINTLQAKELSRKCSEAKSRILSCSDDVFLDSVL